VEAASIVDRHLPDLEGARRTTAERLIELILGELSDAQNERKWGQLTFTREGDWHHWICAVSPTKKAVKLVIHKGALLEDPRGVLEGSGRYMRSIPFSSPDEIDSRVVTPILRQAADRQREMLPGDSS
jgi:hypothetical protein